MDQRGQFIGYCPIVGRHIFIMIGSVRIKDCEPNQITPAVSAGIDLKLGDNKLGDLITKSAEVKEQKKKEYSLEPQLGKTAEYIDIKREADCISIKPKGWLPKPMWRQINDILSINGFNWLENGKESHWIKMKQQEVGRG